jgi:serine/threonine protein kinase
MLVSTLLNHPHIVNLRSLIPPTSYREFGDALFVLDFVETNLRDLLAADKKSVCDSAQFIMFQLLSALNYIHSADIVHGDIRPERIAMDNDCNIKVGDIAVTYVEDDFGTADFTPKMWYRAPEVLEQHAPSSVSFKMDLWAAGCVMAELLGVDVLFRGGNSIQQALEMQGTIVSDLDNMFQDRDPVALDLLKKLLCINPLERMSADMALRHEWLRSFVSSDSEVLSEEKYDWEYEKHFNTVTSVKRAAFDTILEFEQIARRSSTPMNRLSSPVQRADALKRMQLRLNSPAVELSQKDLMLRFQQSMEKNPQLMDDEKGDCISPREKKKSLFERMRDLFAKR